MKVPRGTRVATSPGRKVQELITNAKTLTGYLRFSTASKSLADYFLFFKEGKVVGAYGEIEGEGELSGDSAHEKILSSPTFDIAEIFALPPKVLDVLFENYPEATLGSKRTVEKRVEESSNYYRIANIKVPILSPHKLFLKISSTDFFALFKDLRKERLSGFVRIFAENLDVVEEGCLFFLGGECAGAVYECGSKVRYGDEALLAIHSCFASPKGLIDVYSGDITRIIERNDAIKVAGEVERIIQAKRVEEKTTHDSIFSEMRLISRAPALLYPSDDIFSYQTLLKILSEKEFSGFLQVKNDTRGIVILVEGKPVGASLFGKKRLLSNDAYEKILEICEGECEVEVYPLESDELSSLLSQTRMAFIGEEAKGDLEKFIVRELGEGSEIEMRRASAFKKQWEKSRREKM
jgi:hypothetical protein